MTSHWKWQSPESALRQFADVLEYWWRMPAGGYHVSSDAVFPTVNYGALMERYASLAKNEGTINPIAQQLLRITIASSFYPKPGANYRDLHPAAVRQRLLRPLYEPPHLEYELDKLASILGKPRSRGLRVRTIPYDHFRELPAVARWLSEHMHLYGNDKLGHAIVAAVNQQAAEHERGVRFDPLGPLAVSWCQVLAWSNPRAAQHAYRYLITCAR